MRRNKRLDSIKILPTTTRNLIWLIGESQNINVETSRAVGFGEQVLVSHREASYNPLP
jgi:hypothetical protein